MRRESVDRAPHLEAGDGALAATGVTAGRILARGKLCAASARKALPRLAEQLGAGVAGGSGGQPRSLVQHAARRAFTLPCTFVAHSNHILD